MRLNFGMYEKGNKYQELILSLFVLILLLISGCLEQQDTASSLNDNLPPIITDCKFEFFDKDISGIVFFTGYAEDIDGIINSYIWELSDGTISYNSSFTHTFTKVGQYNATLTVVDNLGATTSETITILIDHVEKI
jgi:hypothetical protein